MQKQTQQCIEKSASTFLYIHRFTGIGTHTHTLADAHTDLLLAVPYLSHSNHRDSASAHLCLARLAGVDKQKASASGPYIMRLRWTSLFSYACDFSVSPLHGCRICDISSA